MSKVKVGDKVRIKPYDEVGEHYGISRWTWERIAREERCINFVYSDGDVKIGLYIFHKSAILPAHDNHVVVVHNNGTDTIAIEKVNGKEVKRAVARCSPEDEYKWETGRDLALNRLLYDGDEHHSTVVIQKLKNRLYNGKVACVKRSPLAPYTVGKIYQFENGRFIDDGGRKMPPMHNAPIFSFKEWNALSESDWLEIVE